MMRRSLSDSTVGLLEKSRHTAAHFGFRQVVMPSEQDTSLKPVSLHGSDSLSSMRRRWVAPDISPGPRESPEVQGVLKVFIETCLRWGLSQDSQVLLLGYRSGDGVGVQLLKGRFRVYSRDVKDRSGYVIAISVGLGVLYEENIKAENDWLRRPHEALGGRCPLKRMLDGSMVDLIAVNRLVERERGL